tara:strand:+ start:29 stop:313 length:285 start_codon:yes stop_codon:yes gene_type:complete
MGLKTIPFREIEEKTENMYEAVSAMFRQAKLELQDRIVAKAIIDHQEAENEDVDVFDEIQEPSPEDYEEKEKVTSIAIDKFMNGDVKWRRSSIE